MQQSIVYTSILWSILFMIGACSITNNDGNTAYIGAQRLEEKVKTCTNNQERLYTLLQGKYIMEEYIPEDSLKVVWRSQIDGDSMLILVQPIGEPSKDGYLLWYGTYLSQATDQSYSNYIIKIEQISRDTLQLWSYKSPRYSLKDLLAKKIEQDLNLKEHIDDSEGIPYGIYVKESNDKFNFSVTRRRFRYGGDDPNTYFREMSGYVNLSEVEIKHSFLNKIGKYTKEVYNYHVRRNDLNLKKWCTLAPKK
ncbi:MAG: hypothetical protein AB8E82_11630 [Aureispira sp.]